MRRHKPAFARGEWQDGRGRTFPRDDTGHAKASQTNDRTQSESDINAASARVEPDGPSASARNFDQRSHQFALFVGEVTVDGDFPILARLRRIERSRLNR